MSDTKNIFEELPDQDTFGGRLSRAREASGLSETELASRLGIKRATVSAWESDRSQPGSHRLSMLSGVLGVSLSWLLHGVGAGPADVEEQELGPSVSLQLDRLMRLHAETRQLIAKLQNGVR